MTPSEKERVSAFLKQLTQAHGLVKDPEADAMIRDAFAQQPDAPYLVVLKAMLLEQALEQARAQLAQMQSRTAQAQSFLAGSPWDAPAAGQAPAAQAPFRPQYQPQAQTLSGGMTSFLGTAASLAAGVAGGALLFEGIESLLGHHGAGGLFGQNAPAPVEETINNYYYGDDSLTAADASDLDMTDYGNDDPGDGGDGTGWV
ncbi:DUF2076 family protein [Thermithiobacillus tepidarius DSM 3134]|uniref:DUF2076 domain-containing protein n=1 Tax=Thermithiobacillus tepidarius TaxID=929 RepID=UPI0003F88591|nr:DUF2076 family protein [Thermithiobacillus tepidarius]